MTDKTSPYIFPFQSFQHLDRTEESATFLPARTVGTADLQPLVERFAPPLALPAEGSLAERILALFVQPDVLFGQAEFVTSRSAEWLAAIETRIAADQPIEFTILGFPFKMPVPLKTNRRDADFGEVVSLCRLNRIGEAIAAHHKPGARVHVLTEGPFHELNGISRDWADGYFASLGRVVERFGIGKHLKLHDLDVVLDDEADFRPAWEEATADIRRRREDGDPATLTAIRDALPVRFHNIANPGVSEDELRRAYRGDEDAAGLRRSITARAEAGVVAYRGFLEARDRIGLLERLVPGGLSMTVSPRPGRLGVRPLPRPANKLPYHGVPVIERGGASLRIDYLWDLRHGGGTLEPLHLEGDADPAPFVYREA
ncbi:L-tyrosine/L-tryptophan isonitrile synthase family protein [Consotaella salsifontis]|uniref:Pyoverdine/dityrosine biosynthesis protein n=1 Tax=Consotaella salsifontis TaxID=1365950 RepID=A0A1T4S778_9HYPH|nr:L-tyrosine/L-tryptophan isonitrile synthase family protein [Consotaella salsifontis]SKA23701.1 Pyoverdine/dityrosine biosynthesis protein [Consotaella salsifontis]